MSFDKIIANAPFDKNLHLKILREAMKHMEKEGGEIVSLEPIRWLQDPLAEYKRGSDWKKFGDVRERIESLDIVDREYAANTFSIRLGCDLGIYHITKNGKGLDLRDKIAMKIYNGCKVHLFDVMEYNKSDGWRVRLSDLRPLNGGSNGKEGTAGYYYKFTLLHYNKSWVYKDGFQNGKHWSFYCGKTGCKQFTENDELPCSIRFDTEEEAHNFEDSTKTKFYKYALSSMKIDQHTPFIGLPFLPTYKKQWTNEDLYEYFNLTPEEIKEIENAF